MKMKQVYEGNPALGDPMSIQGQLTENEKRLTTLQSEKKKFQASLVQLGLGVRSRPSRWSRVTVGFTRLWPRLLKPTFNKVMCWQDLKYTLSPPRNPKFNWWISVVIFFMPSCRITWTKWTLPVCRLWPPLLHIFPSVNCQSKETLQFHLPQVKTEALNT